MYRSVLCSSPTAVRIGSRQLLYILLAIRTSVGTANARITYLVQAR